MGNYYTVKAISGKKETNLTTLKFSLGAAELGFSESAFHYTPGKEYYAKENITPFLDNLKYYKERIENNNKTLDTWSNQYVNNQATMIDKLISAIQHMPENTYIYADMSESLPLIDEDNKDFYAAKDSLKAKKQLMQIMDGIMCGRYTDYNTLVQENKKFNNILNPILNKTPLFKEVDTFGTVNDTKPINMGKYKGFKCRRTIYFNKAQAVSSYEEWDFYMTTLFHELQKLNIYMEENWDNTPNTDDNEVAFICNFYWMKEE